MKEFVR